MVSRQELHSFLDNLLAVPPECHDASNNGVQIEGAETIEHVVFGVDACDALFREAARQQAQFIVVHHGLSWGNGFRTITGITAARLRQLFRADISLYASHLPLDAHPQFGNNVVIAQSLGLQQPVPFCRYGGIHIGVAGDLATALTLTELQAAVGTALNINNVALWPGNVAATAKISRIGVVSGGGADAVEQCAAAGVQCLLTGEMDHGHYHMACELNIAVLAAGHYATETFGVKAVMAEVARQFPVRCSFIDLPTAL